VFVLKVVIPRAARDLGFLLRADPSNRRHRCLRDLRDETKCLRLIPLSGEIIPLGIRRFDPSNPLDAGPSLDLLFPFNRIPQVAEAFEIEEPGDVALGRKTASQFQLGSRTRRRVLFVNPA
jgi:hypothetical protein